MGHVLTGTLNSMKTIDGTVYSRFFIIKHAIPNTSINNNQNRVRNIKEIKHLSKMRQIKHDPTLNFENIHDCFFLSRFLFTEINSDRFNENEDESIEPLHNKF